MALEEAGRKVQGVALSYQMEGFSTVGRGNLVGNQERAGFESAFDREAFVAADQREGRGEKPNQNPNDATSDTSDISSFQQSQTESFTPEAQSSGYAQRAGKAHKSAIEISEDEASEESVLYQQPSDDDGVQYEDEFAEVEAGEGYTHGSKINDESSELAPQHSMKGDRGAGDEENAKAFKSESMQDSLKAEPVTKAQSIKEARQFDQKITGDGNNNKLIGGGKDDFISGGGGKDLINSGRGDDVVLGGAGNDKIFTGSGDDIAYGGSGNDRIYSGSGDDTVYAGSGHDYVNAGRGDDTVSGGAGNDRMHGGSGNDVMDGGSGNDRMHGGSGDDVMDGGSGNDRLSGGSGKDTIDAGSGHDYVNAGRGDDTISGGAGNDRIHGGSGDDIIDGGSGNDRIFGGSGDDVIDGGAGNDRIKAGSGDDTVIIYANQGNDTIDGGAGVDTLNVHGTTWNVHIDGAGDMSVSDFLGSNYAQDGGEMSGYLWTGEGGADDPGATVVTFNDIEGISFTDVPI